MRHGDKINNLSRTKAHRKALLSNMAAQLIEHKRIFTTKAKAKALRIYVEPIITKSKNDTTHNRRLVFDKLQDKKAVSELFGVISNKIANRPGGYTRIIKLAPRFGDAAEMAMIELVDFNTIYEKGDAKAGKKTRRSRRGSGSGSSNKTKTADVKEEATATEVKTEETTPEAKVVETAEPATEVQTEDNVASVEPETTAEKAQDDLTKIEGIGPKIAEALHHAGIATFADLNNKSAEEVKEILKAAEGRFGAADPTTWAQQADLAAQGKWDELKQLQEELKGGKEVKE